MLGTIELHVFYFIKQQQKIKVLVDLVDDELASQLMLRIDAESRLLIGYYVGTATACKQILEKLSMSFTENSNRKKTTTPLLI